MELDLLGRTWEVQILRRADLDRHGYGPAFYVGEATFSATEPPFVRRLGKRWHITCDRLPGVLFTTDGGDYRIGGRVLDNETWVIELAERFKSARTPEEDDTLDQLEKHVTDFFADRGLEITFE
jgi:hypothetical protein